MAELQKKYPTLPVVRFVCAPNENIIVGPHLWEATEEDASTGEEVQVSVRERP